jgi:hypothetical protein
MSDLGRLFRLRGAPDLEPLENFTTVALAIAIGHDDRPMRQALRAVDWTYKDATGQPARARFGVATADVVAVAAETQVALWPADGITLSYLDLVLTVSDAEQRRSAIWVEVKVNALESGEQLATYESHAARLSPSPAIITLGRMRVSPHCPCLKWSDIVDAIGSVPDPHPSWLSLREFLLDQRIVRPPLPTELTIEADARIDIIVDVNRRVRDLWPNAGAGLAWVDGALRNYLRKSVEAHQELAASAGPLLYGLMAVGKSWEWSLVVTATRNYQRVRLDAQDIRRDAEVGGLPQDWLRYTDRFEVLERRLAPGTLDSHDEIVAWFDEGLRQLRDAKIVDRYLTGLTTKHAGYGGGAGPTG